MRKKFLVLEAVVLLCFFLSAWFSSLLPPARQRQTPALCLLPSADLSLVGPGGHQAAFPPASRPGTGTHSRYTQQVNTPILSSGERGCKPTAQHKHNPILGKCCPTSSLTCGAQPADGCWRRKHLMCFQVRDKYGGDNTQDRREKGCSLFT